MSLKRLRIGDLALVLVLLVAFGIWFGFSKVIPHRGGDEMGPGGYAFVVSVKGKEIHRAPLLSSAEIQHVTIPLDGDSDSEALLEIVDGSLRVLPMTRELCPNQICCHFSPPISKPGQLIVCLPNEMIISIEGRHDLGYDVIAG
jgi:hypothetical protein